MYDARVRYSSSSGLDSLDSSATVQVLWVSILWILPVLLPVFPNHVLGRTGTDLSVISHFGAIPQLPGMWLYDYSQHFKVAYCEVQKYRHYFRDNAARYNRGYTYYSQHFARMLQAVCTA